MKIVMRNSLICTFVVGLLSETTFAQTPVEPDVQASTSASSSETNTNIPKEPAKDAAEATVGAVESVVADETASGTSIVGTSSSAADTATGPDADKSDDAVDTGPEVMPPGSANLNAQRTGNAGYLQALSNEAKTDDRLGSDTNVGDTVGNDRTNRIRGIVADALDTQGENPEPMNPSRAPDAKEFAAQSRRQELRSAIDSATRATDSDGDLYLSILQNEGERTVVIDEQTSRRPAISRPMQIPSRLQGTEPSLAGARTYQVQEGDSLWLIAERLYGDGHRYLILFEANKDEITDENLLVVGQLLRIP